MSVNASYSTCFRFAGLKTFSFPGEDTADPKKVLAKMRKLIEQDKFWITEIDLSKPDDQDYDDTKNDSAVFIRITHIGPAGSPLPDPKTFLDAIDLLSAAPEFKIINDEWHYSDTGAERRYFHYEGIYRF
jgi:hypothetical protein